MHLAARYGNEAVLLAIVNKIGAGMVQIVQNKKSKVKQSLISILKFIERMVSLTRSMCARTRWRIKNTPKTPRKN
jgi:hypothetical protein